MNSNKVLKNFVDFIILGIDILDEIIFGIYFQSNTKTIKLVDIFLSIGSFITNFHFKNIHYFKKSFILYYSKYQICKPTNHKR